MLSNHLILCHPFLLLSSVFPSSRVFSNEYALCIWWQKYWSFSQSPSNEYSGLISFRIDRFDLLAVQRTLKSLLQHHNSKASILPLALSLLYGPDLTSLHDYWKNLSFVQTFVGKVMSLLLNALSRFVIAFLPRSKCLLILWLQSLSAVIFGAQENKICHCFLFSPFCLPWSDGTGCHDLTCSAASVASYSFRPYGL